MSILAVAMAAAMISHPAGLSEEDAATQLGSATAAMLVEWESARPPDRYRFYRRRESSETQEVTWSVSRNVATADLGEVVVSSDRCPDLTEQMGRLETLQIGSVISPPSTLSPVSTLGPALYTVWGRNRSDSGRGQTVMVRSQEGPVAEWGRDTLAIIASCEAARARH